MSIIDKEKQKEAKRVLAWLENHANREDEENSRVRAVYNSLPTGLKKRINEEKTTKADRIDLNMATMGLQTFCPMLKISTTYL